MLAVFFTRACDTCAWNVGRSCNCANRVLAHPITSKMRIKREIARCFRVAFCALVVKISGLDVKHGAVLCRYGVLAAGAGLVAAGARAALGVAACSVVGTLLLELPGPLMRRGGGCLCKLLGAALGLGLGLGLAVICCDH